MNNKAVVHLLSNTSYWRLSKVLVKTLGLTKAFALTDLIDKFEFHRNNNQLVEDKWFFYRREDMAENWGLQFDAQRRVLKELESLNLISYEKRGPMPQKNYYSINQSEVQSFIEKNMVNLDL